jgi:hypothetical protein
MQTYFHLRSSLRVLKKKNWNVVTIPGKSQILYILTIGQTVILKIKGEFF